MFMSSPRNRISRFGLKRKNELYYILLKVRDTDFSAFKYFDKTELKSQSDRPYAGDKTSFSLSRGQRWYLDNKRPDRLRSSLKELEELLTEQSVIYSGWRGASVYQLVLQTGLIVNIGVNRYGDLTRITFDKFLVGKISEHVTDCVVTSGHILVTYLEPRLTIVTLTRQADQLVNSEARIQHLDLHCPPGRRLDRRLVVSSDAGQCLVWWPADGQEVYPWSPQLKEEDRANMAVISLKPQPHVLGYHRTTSDPIYFRFLSDTIHYLGQSQQQARRGETELENTILTVSDQDKLIRRKVSRSVVVSNCIVCHATVPNSDNVILAAMDGTIFTFDQVENKVDNQVRAGFIAQHISCHPDGAIIVAVSEAGLVQCYDIALTPVTLVFPNEEQVTGSVLDTSLYFRTPITVKGASWCQGDSSGNVIDQNQLMMRLQGGPLMVVRFNTGVYSGGRIGPVQIVAQYLKYNLYHQVLLFLSQLSWLYSGNTLIICLTQAFNAFLKLPFTREKECLLEMCLGLFHAPAKPITDQVKAFLIDRYTKYNFWLSKDLTMIV